VTKSAIYFLESDLRTKTGYDLFDIDTSCAAELMEHIPAYFIVSKDDYVTQATEVTKLYETYACTKKKLAKVSGLHHSFRQTYELANAAEFLHNIEEAIKDESILNNLLYDKIKIYHDFSYEGLDVADENVIINDTR
jgi:hypothetical protein